MVLTFAVIKAVVAYPFAAFLAMVEVQVGFKVRRLKCRFMLLGPKQASGFLILNCRKTVKFERNAGAFPGFTALVAVKAERKCVRIGMVYRSFCKRFAHIDFILGGIYGLSSCKNYNFAVFEQFYSCKNYSLEIFDHFLLIVCLFSKFHTIFFY